MSDRPDHRPAMPAAAPPPYNSLVAAAQVMTRGGLIPGAANRARVTPPTEWMRNMWGWYDTIGEFRSGVNWASNGLSRLNLYAARPPRSAGDQPDPIHPDDEGVTAGELFAMEMVAAIAGGPVGQGQLQGEMGKHLTVAGIGWLAVEPDLEDPDAEEYVTWQVLGSDCVERRLSARRDREHEWWVNDCGEFRRAHPNALIVKVWRKHPRRPWEPDSPSRAAALILDQIETLTLSITAVATSRLAGNGLLVMPTEFVFPPSQIQSTPGPGDPDPDDVPTDADLFIETFIQASIVPIKDRGTAAAVVPLVVQVPGEHLSKLVHLTFEMQGDDTVIAKIEFAIRRLALSMDMPPEVLLGLGATNHWNADAIVESAISMHLEPNGEAFCQAVTDGFLLPAMAAAGFQDRVMIWYDASDLSTPPDKSAAVQAAYDRRAASEWALRRGLGLDDTDRPDDDEFRRRVLLDAMAADPSLAPVILAELGFIDAALASRLLETKTEPARPAAAGSDGLLAAADGLVYRALDRAGQRLRSVVGKATPGGAAAVVCPDPSRLHLSVDATAHSTLDALLDGAWVRVPEIAARYQMDPDLFTNALNAYTRSLIASSHEHTMDRLAEALGIG